MIALLPFTAVNQRTGAELGPFDELWDVVEAARESVKRTSVRWGDADHDATDFVTIDRHRRTVERFRIDCDGQYFEYDAAGNLIIPD